MNYFAWGVKKPVAAWVCMLGMLLVPAAAAAASEVVKVPEKEARQAVASKQEPDYPAMAKQLKITGKATIEILIDAEGKVEHCEPIVGNPLLTGAVVKAVKGWTFRPFKADGRQTKATTRLTFEFGL